MKSPSKGESNDVMLELLDVKMQPLVKDVLGVAHEFAREFILNVEKASDLYGVGSKPQKSYFLCWGV